MTNEQKQINALREAVSGLGVELRECVTGKDAQDACSAILAKLLHKPGPAVIPEPTAFRRHMAVAFPDVQSSDVRRWTEQLNTWQAAVDEMDSYCCHECRRIAEKLRDPDLH